MKYSKFPALLVACITMLYACSSDSEDPTPEPVPDTIAPEVEFTIPGNTTGGSSSTETPVISNQLIINVDAKDAGGIAKVEAFINDQKVGEDTVAPYQITIDVSSYASKNASTGKFTDYTLKITVTDTSGNESSKERIIHIDNELPSITEVSLTSGLVIGGNTNSITFSVVDNEGLSGVNIYINNELASEIIDDKYEFNINTLDLPDGENTLKIEAFDLAYNTAIHEVTFLSDNTGPLIVPNTVEEGQILDEEFLMSISLSDKYSNVTMVDVTLGDQNLLTNAVDFPAGTDGQVDFDLNPENYSTGEQILKIIAFDTLGNTSVTEIPVRILRLLVTIAIPEGYLSPNISSNHFAFVSDMNGEPIDLEEIFFETREVKLYAEGEFNITKNFVLTFASIVGPVGDTSYLYSIMNLTRENPGALELEVPKRFSYNGEIPYPINGFSASSQLYCFGKDFSFSSSESGNTLIGTSSPQNHSTGTEHIYIYSYNSLNNDYRYQFVPKPIPNGFEINYEDFTTDGLTDQSIDLSTFSNDGRSSLAIFGYNNDVEFENDFQSQIWRSGYGYQISQFPYRLNGNFHGYSHDFIRGNYRSFGAGLPSSQPVAPNWTIDYTHNSNQIALNLTGNDHTTGRILFNGGYDVQMPYEWQLEFNSQQETSITLPKIPEDMQSFAINNHYQNASFELLHLELLKFQGIDSYNEYITNIVKTNKSFKKTAFQFQSIFKSEIDGYQPFTRSSYFYNEW